MISETWYCCRQRAGSLVKECRALRPRFGAEDSASVHSKKAEAKKYYRTAVNRTPEDRMEERFAVIGWDAWQYVLTFDDEYLPKNYAGVQDRFRAFRTAVRRWLQKCGKPPDFDWVSIIEGLHGDHRWHIHFICDYYTLGPVEIQRLWKYGDVTDASPVLQDKEGFWRLAFYFNKERRGGVIPVGKQPFTCSRSVNAKLRPPEKWKSDSNLIEPPANAICFSTPDHLPSIPYDNGWGKFYHLSWLEPDGSPGCRAAMRRMGYVDESYARVTD